MIAENVRLQEARSGKPWKKWGPYVSERQWGTVREDYSPGGTAWDYFPHDQARSRAYKWGEDGLAGFCDDKQILCFGIALWNGQDPILKERLFGLTNSEGNHGEDVKEYYFYLDGTPTHSYMKYLYKYPQRAYPYNDLVTKNRQRSREELEYELLDTGMFDDDRYFDVFVEYAKQAPDDIWIRIAAVNRGPQNAMLHLLPTLWYRVRWFAGATKPELRALHAGLTAIRAPHPELGENFLYLDGPADLLFTENETNTQRVFGLPNAVPWVKDAFHEYVIRGRADAVNPELVGTKAAVHLVADVPAGETWQTCLRLTTAKPETVSAERAKSRTLGAMAEQIFQARRKEADEFYQSITPPALTADEREVMRQALAGMLWTKQHYSFDVNRWLEEHAGGNREAAERAGVRNRDWYHMMNDSIVSMPDKWEYPWYAAWDLAFHTGVLSMVDVDFAKEQLELMLRPTYMHPSGQLPAYEWNFSDVNPPVHAWATLFLYNTEKMQRGQPDVEFLKGMFNRLLLNFTWWVNRKDRDGKNVFEGGFLGLDNIGVFDRSAPLPTGGYIEQADGTAWMALFCLNMLEMAVELAVYDRSYEDLVVKFVEHFFWIAAAINKPGAGGLWDEEDGFYYDMLRTPDGGSTRLKVRSIVGLVPFCAVDVVENYQRQQVPRAVEQIYWRFNQMPDVKASAHPTGPGHFGIAERGILGLVNPERLKRILSRVLDEQEFLGPYGIRALSRYHLQHPYVFYAGGQEYRVDYMPAESTNGMFGGNSNWRGPVWFPMNALVLRALLQYYLYYGDSFKVECPTGSGKRMNLFEVGQEIATRLMRIFLRDEQGRRPVYGGTEKFQKDPHWKDYILFYEYFHGDNGAGIGASHQTGWTGLVARLMQMYARVDAKDYLEQGKKLSTAYQKAATAAA